VVTESYENKKKSVDEDRKEIEQKKRERDLLNKDVATAEEKGREQESTKLALENELKKLQNKIQGYQAEIMKLHKLIRQLENDKYKYGVEAS
jgi:chromosome segregation ATPase